MGKVRVHHIEEIDGVKYAIEHARKFKDLRLASCLWRFLRSKGEVRMIHIDEWPFPPRTRGITFFPFIFYREPVPREKIIRHELEHIEQQKEDGFLFWWRYLRDFLKDGYDEMDYEMAAKAAEKRHAHRF